MKLFCCILNVIQVLTTWWQCQLFTGNEWYIQCNATVTVNTPTIVPDSFECSFVFIGISFLWRQDRFTLRFLWGFCFSYKIIIKGREKIVYKKSATSSFVQTGPLGLKLWKCLFQTLLLRQDALLQCSRLCNSRKNKTGESLVVLFAFDVWEDLCHMKSFNTTTPIKYIGLLLTVLLASQRVATFDID